MLTAMPQITVPRMVLERGDGRGEQTFAWWTRGPHAADGPLFVSATDFYVPRTADLLRVYLEGLRLRRAWPSLSGAVGMWTWTMPLRKRAGSVSVWRDESDLQRFIRWAPHVRVMRGYRDRGEISSLSWLEPSFAPRSVWANAVARLARARLERDGQAGAT